MDHESDTHHAFIVVRKWRVGSKPEEGVVGIEFVDAHGELHSFALSAATARGLIPQLEKHAELVASPGQSGRA